MCGVCCVVGRILLCGIDSYLVVWGVGLLYLVGWWYLWCGGYINFVLFVVLATFRGS